MNAIFSFTDFAVPNVVGPHSLILIGDSANAPQSDFLSIAILFVVGKSHVYGSRRERNNELPA